MENKKMRMIMRMKMENYQMRMNKRYHWMEKRIKNLYRIKGMMMMKKKKMIMKKMGNRN
jgi:hypothetical protein